MNKDQVPDEFLVRLEKVILIEKLQTRIEKIFKVKIKKGISVSAEDGSEKTSQWITLTGRPAKRKKAKSYIISFCNPEETMTVPYPSHLRPVLTSPKVHLHLERQSQAVVIFPEEEDEVAIYGSTLSVTLAVSSLEDLIERETAAQREEGNDYSRQNSDVSQLLDKQLKETLSARDDIDMDVTQNETMGNAVKRVMLNLLNHHDDSDSEGSGHEDDENDVTAIYTPAHDITYLTVDETGGDIDDGSIVVIDETHGDMEDTILIDDSRIDESAGGIEDITFVKPVPSTSKGPQPIPKKRQSLSKKPVKDPDATEVMQLPTGFIPHENIKKIPTDPSYSSSSKTKMNEEDAFIIEQYNKTAKSMGYSKDDVEDVVAIYGTLLVTSDFIKAIRSIKSKTVTPLATKPTLVGNDKPIDITLPQASSTPMCNSRTRPFLNKIDITDLNKTDEGHPDDHESSGGRSEVKDTERSGVKDIKRSDVKDTERSDSPTDLHLAAYLQRLPNDDLSQEDQVSFDVLMSNSEEKQKLLKEAFEIQQSMLEDDSPVKSTQSNKIRKAEAIPSPGKSRKKTKKQRHKSGEMEAVEEKTEDAVDAKIRGQWTAPPPLMEVHLAHYDEAPPPRSLSPPIDNPKDLRYVVIDGSNVAMAHGKGKEFSCRGIKIAVDYFLKRGHKEVTAFVPQFRQRGFNYKNPAKDQKVLTELREQGNLVFTPSRKVEGRHQVCYDDRFIVQLAAETDGVIVSNDNYRDLMTQKPEWKHIIVNRLLMYSFVGDIFMLPDDPHGRNGPSLSQLLSKVPARQNRNYNPNTAGTLPGHASNRSLLEEQNNMKRYANKTPYNYTNQNQGYNVHQQTQYANNRNQGYGHGQRTAPYSMNERPYTHTALNYPLVPTSYQQGILGNQPSTSGNPYQVKNPNVGHGRGVPVRYGDYSHPDFTGLHRQGPSHTSTLDVVDSVKQPPLQNQQKQNPRKTRWDTVDSAKPCLTKSNSNHSRLKRSLDKTTELCKQLEDIFPENDDNIKTVLSNHPYDTDISKLSSYLLDMLD